MTAKNVRMLNRVIPWTGHCFSREADQRHAEIVISEFGLVEAKVAPTLRSCEGAGKALQDDSQLSKADATKYCTFVLRFAHLSVDRFDI